MTQPEEKWEDLSPEERYERVIAARPVVPRRGKISLTKGPMFSEKSTWLMLVAFRAIRRGKRVALLRPEMDTRDCGIHGISTHNNQQLLANDKIKYFTFKETPSEKTFKIDDWDTVLIEEAQFWNYDLVTFCLRLSQRGTSVFVAGLSGDLNMKPWKTVDAITAIADSVHTVFADCGVCEAPAPFTICTAVFTGNVHPGADDYHAVCGDCREKWVHGVGGPLAKK